MPRTTAYLTLRAAADILNVSVGYVEKLIDLGKFEGIVRSSPGRLKLPRTEVERVNAEIKAISRTALDSLNEATAMARAIEDSAAGAPKRKWVRAK